MKRFALAAGLLALAFSGSTRADDADEKKALKELEGTYLITSLEKEGLKITEADLTKLGVKEEDRKVVIKGDQIIAFHGGKEDPGTLKLDPTKKPPHIDITSKKEVDINGKKEVKVEVNYGIYKFEGGNLTVCAVEEGTAKDRPTEFKAAGKAMMIVFKKQPAK